MVFRSDLSQALMATLHPAYIIRQSTKTYDGGFSLLVEDIAKAWRGASRIREVRGAGGLRDRKIERGLKKELEIDSDRLKMFDS